MHILYTGAARNVPQLQDYPYNNDYNDYDDNDEWNINLSSTELIGIGSLLLVILLLNIMCIGYRNCGYNGRNKGYGIVKYDSEQFEQSEANAINIAAE